METAREETPGMALASIEPVSCAAVAVGGEELSPGRQAPENELPSSVVASKISCSVTSDGELPLGDKDKEQKYTIAKVVSLLGIVKVTAPDVGVAGVKEPEPILVATAVGVTPVMVNVIVVGAPPPRFPALMEAPQPQTNAAKSKNRK
jgi:hypothetical protein